MQEVSAMQHSFYQSALKEALALRIELQHKIQRMVLYRTGAFICAVFSFAAGYDGHHLFYALSVALFGTFVGLIRHQHKMERKLASCEAELAALSGIFARFDDGWKSLSETGEEYLEKASPQFTDLHIFGDASLYQYLCRARTKAGRDRLASSFQTVAPADITSLKDRQEAVKEIASNQRMALELESMGACLPENHDMKSLLEKLAKGDIKKSNRRAIWCIVAISINILLVILTCCEIVSWMFPCSFIGVLFLFAWMTSRKTDMEIVLLEPLAASFASYEQIFQKMEWMDVQSSHLQHLQDVLRGKDGIMSASMSIHRLAKLADWASMRKNFFFYALANGLFLFDFWAEAEFQRWKDENGNRLTGFLDVWSEMEVVLSLSTIAIARENVCYPEFLSDTGSPQVYAEKLENPLLPEQSAIPNDADMFPSTTIITGSNMSGKTTWLRTVGINVILSWAGAPVCAKSFELSPLALFTSIRVDDDLAHGISTFYAELLRIKSMIIAEETGKPLLLLIDEIFKGTNSADRIMGAEAALARLTNDHTIVLVTTHDFELCELKVSGGIVRNAHFEEHYENGKILFDYQLKDGRCVTTNAKYLLRMVGIM